jgi:hypothetical protein
VRYNAVACDTAAALSFETQLLLFLAMLIVVIMVYVVVIMVLLAQ